MNGCSLFANVGIAETFLETQNIKIKVANELIEKRASFYSDLYPNCNMVVGDITDKKIYQKLLTQAKKHKCEFLLITPPCQGMSVAGKMSEVDKRNYLITYAVQFIKDLKPKHVILENVPQMLTTTIKIKGKKITIKEYLIKELKSYTLNFKVIDSSDYGIPQVRKRAFVLISKNEKWEFPKPKNKKISVREAIGHLPSLESGEKSKIKFHYAKTHSKRHVIPLKHTPTGKTALHNKKFYPKKPNGDKVKGFATTYKRIDWDRPAPTITMCNGSVSSQNNVHPGRLKKDGTYSDARVLTLKEILF